jgi:hypothetical protein
MVDIYIYVVFRNSCVNRTMFIKFNQVKFGRARKRYKNVYNIVLNIQVRAVPSNTTLFILYQHATCFDLNRSPSGVTHDSSKPR